MFVSFCDIKFLSKCMKLNWHIEKFVGKRNTKIVSMLSDVPPLLNFVFSHFIFHKRLNFAKNVVEYKAN